MSKSTTTVKKPSKPSKPRWTPPPYQRRAVKFLLEHYSAGLLLDPGLGKTSITIAASKILLKEGVMTGGLVVAPLRPAVSTWPNEVDKWADFEGVDLVVLHGKEFSKLCREQHNLYVVNYEGLQKLFTRRRVGKVWKYELTEDGRELMKHINALIWDELSKMKNSNTQRFKLVRPWLKKFLIKWGLTGSPASNGYLDLFGECFVLDEGRTLGPFVTQYRSQYFIPLDDFSWRLKGGAEGAILDRVRPLVLRMDADDYLKMPQQLDHVMKFDLPADAREHYDNMESDLLTRISDNLVKASNAASSSAKCRQIASGAVYKEDFDLLTGLPIRRSKSEREWLGLHDEKLALLEDLVDELNGHQLMVAYDFNHDLERLLERFPNTPYIGGGVSVKRGREIEKQWNDGELSMMFVHPASVGHGMNFQEGQAHHVAWFTMSYDFELYDQLNRRLRRQGNRENYVHVYHFCAKDTVEESVYFALRRKFKTQKEFLDALKTRKRIADLDQKS